MLALTMGEPAGIGGELSLAAWRSRARSSVPSFVVLDDPERLGALATQLGWPVPIEPVADPRAAAAAFDRALPVMSIGSVWPTAPGRPEPATAPAVIGSIDRAIELARSGAVDAIVTNPIQKRVLLESGFAHPGHTEYLAARADGRPVAMMLVSRRLKVVPVTVHVPLADVSSNLSVERIVDAGTVAAAALRRDFGVANPRLAVAALNPHGGEGGALGDEEARIIAPAVAALRGQGIETMGPAPADTLFHEAARARYDAALCMYHDQALIPLKALDFEDGVNVTIGLPFIRTSPDHGTALDIAGQGVANPASLIAALALAAEMATRRRSA